MECLGNRRLLSLPKTAFLASSTIPTEMVLRCYDWAQQASRKDECVVSGFASHLEQQVLHFLLKGTCPVILVLGRQLYRRIPEELQPHLASGRLLIVSATNAPRQSRATAQARNKYVCELADSIVFVGVDETSSLFPLKEAHKRKLVAL